MTPYQGFWDDGVRKLPEQAREAAAWVANAFNNSGYRADFTLSSLKEIDRFIDENSANGEPTANGLLAEDLEDRVFALGSYVGEVLIREVGGRWEGEANEKYGWLNITLILGDRHMLWPVQRVGKRLRNGPEDEVYGYGHSIVAELKPPAEFVSDRLDKAKRP